MKPNQKKKFKAEFIFTVEGEYDTEQFKQDMMRIFTDIQVYNVNDEEVEIDSPDYWETAKITDITHEDDDLRKAMERLRDLDEDIFPVNLSEETTERYVTIKVPEGSYIIPPSRDK